MRTFFEVLFLIVGILAAIFVMRDRFRADRRYEQLKEEDRRSRRNDNT